MSEPFTVEELDRRRENGKEILRPGFYYFGELQPRVIAREILRYHATLQAKEEQIEALVKLLRRTWHQIQADNQDRAVQLACRAGLGVSEWRNLMPAIWFEIDAAITGLETAIKEATT